MKTLTSAIPLMLLMSVACASSVDPFPDPSPATGDNGMLPNLPSITSHSIATTAPSEYAEGPDAREISMHFVVAIKSGNLGRARELLPLVPMEEYLWALHRALSDNHQSAINLLLTREQKIAQHEFDKLFYVSFESKCTQRLMDKFQKRPSQYAIDASFTFTNIKYLGLEAAMGLFKELKPSQQAIDLAFVDLTRLQAPTTVTKFLACFQPSHSSLLSAITTAIDGRRDGMVTFLLNLDGAEYSVKELTQLERHARKKQHKPVRKHLTKLRSKRLGWMRRLWELVTLRSLREKLFH